MKFNGTIIITDPCYICNHDFDNKHEREWFSEWDRMLGDDLKGNRQHMFSRGFSQYIWEDTLYGDWSCTVFDSKTKMPLNVPYKHFCADAGLVGVFYEKEVLKYNPKFKVDGYMAAAIPDFKGDVHYDINKHGEARIIAIGSHNFYTSQTGM